MKATYQEVSQGLDQLFFSEVLGNSMSVEDRAEVIETFLKGSGWSFDEYVDRLMEEPCIDNLSHYGRLV